MKCLKSRFVLATALTLLILAPLSATAAERATKVTARARNYVEWNLKTNGKVLPLPPVRPNAEYDLDILTNPTHYQYSEYVDAVTEDIPSRCVTLSQVTGLVNPPTGWNKLFTKRFDMSLASNETLGVSFSGQFNVQYDTTGTGDGVYLLCTLNPVDRYGVVDESRTEYCSASQFFPNLLGQIPVYSQLLVTSYHGFVRRPADWLDTSGIDAELRVWIGTGSGFAGQACYMNLGVAY